MTRMYRTLFLLLIVPYLISCDHTKREAITSDVLVSVAKHDGQVDLVLTTKDSYSCSNYTIRYRLKQRKGKMTLLLKDAVAPDVCLTAIGPASSSISLGDLENGTHPIRFTLNGQETTGVLSVSDGSVSLELEDGNVKLML